MSKDEKKDKDTEKVVDGLITAVYKVNLHCQQCARDIRVPLMKSQGVHKVDADFESHRITVKGVIDPKKIHERIEKLSKKKVELISPQIKISTATVVTEKKIVKEEIKEPILRKTLVKVHLHCQKCEHDLQKKLLKHKGVYGVKTDMKAQTITVDGSIEPEKLVTYLRKKVHKHAEIIPPKPEKKEETKKEEKKKETVKVEAKITETTSTIVEFKEEKKVEAKKEKDGNVPYFIHYVYAPQTFSDENPNACCVM